MTSLKKILVKGLAASCMMLAICGTAYADAPNVIIAYQQSSVGPGSGWKAQENGTWKYEENGAPIVNDWKEVDGKRYRLGADGVMLTGWQTIDGIRYYFTENEDAAHPLGSMYVSEVTPDGCEVNADGVIISIPNANTDGIVRANPYSGQTCVEISISEQRVYVYQGEALVVSSPCVTGSVAGGHSTPRGDYHIYSKETNRYLQGYNNNGTKYKSYVNFWMPFNGGVGLHDADGWRSAYGGEIYKTGGSHGCVNLPYGKAAAIFNVVYVGMPVHVND